MAKYVIGVDGGTESLRAGVFDASGGQGSQDLRVRKRTTACQAAGVRRLLGGLGATGHVAGSTTCCSSCVFATTHTADDAAAPLPLHAHARRHAYPRPGRPLAFASSPYATAYPQPSWAEQDPSDWWRALGEAVRGAVAEAAVAPADIAAISVDTTCCTVVALDAAGQPLRPALLWWVRGFAGNTLRSWPGDRRALHQAQAEERKHTLCGGVPPR